MLYLYSDILFIKERSELWIYSATGIKTRNTALLEGR